MIWGALLHLSFNMWADRYSDRGSVLDKWTPESPVLQCDKQLWLDVTEQMARDGLNTVLIDVGDGVLFDSHPEIAVDGAWTPQEMRDEVRRLRALGLNPVPKLNFATSHDVWLKEYSRMVSTKKYYEVCKELIAETMEIFESPALFHLGMDEETVGHQEFYDYLVVRQGDLFWHDIQFFVDQVESRGAQAWIWSDHAWRNRDAFLAKMPRSVLQSNWYYAPAVSEADFPNMEHRRKMLKAFDDLEAHGFDQVPCGSTLDAPENLSNLTKYCGDVISADHLKGYLMTTWFPFVEDFRDKQIDAIRVAGEVRRSFPAAPATKS